MSEYVVVTITGHRVCVGADDFQAGKTYVDFLKDNERIARFYANGISGFFKVRDYDEEQEHDDAS